ncbi:30S ribosomal protein S1 [Rickettsiales bacterium LUAb2]
MAEQKPNLNNENFDELFKQSISGVTSFNDQLVKGKVIRITDDFVIVDVGLKSEGKIPLYEFKNEDGNIEEIKAGDIIEVFVDKYEDREGLIVLSKEKARREEAWYQLEILCKEGTPVEGLITKRVKGGFMVLVKSAVAFLPGSQLDVRPMKNINALVGTKQLLKILTTDRKRYNIVVSRKSIIEQNLKDEGVSIGANYTEGQIIEGVVKNITGYGAFIDLGSIDGLLHVTDISWSRVNHPSEVLKVGQTLQVKVIKIHPETGRVSLGIKQLTEDPWVSIDKKYEIGSKFNVKITNITDYGVFVELEKGVEGLVHISEMAWGRNITHPSSVYKVGDAVDTVILDIDFKKRRISLSIKQCTENPWSDYAKVSPVGTDIEGTIKSVDENGIVVSLNDNIDGFIKAQDIAWGLANKEAVEPYLNKIGEKIKAKVIRNDVEREKINLGIKQFDKDPFAEVTKEFSKGAVVKAKILEISDKGLDVELKEGINGFIKKFDISSDRESQRTNSFSVGDEVEAIIINIDENDRVFNLSIKALEQMDHKKYIGAQETSTNNLADILDEAMNKKENK